MKKIIVFLAIFVSTTSYSQYYLSRGYLELLPPENVDSNFTCNGLKLFPLLAGERFINSHKHFGQYTTLEQALKDNKIEIVEKGLSQDSVQSGGDLNRVNQSEQQFIPDVRQVDANQALLQQMMNYSGDEVNNLQVNNLSEDTLYLMAGEIIKGGKQDRTLAEDMVIPPGEKGVDLPVFCVEKGRWRYKGEQEKVFGGYFSVSSNKVRSVVTKQKNQKAVWEAVQVVAEDYDVESETGAYTELEKSSEFQKTREDFILFYENAFASIDNCVGFIGVNQQKIIGCDIFATPGLFTKQFTNLLHAYITERSKTKDSYKIGYEEVKAYLHEFLRPGEDQETIISERGSHFKIGNRILHVNTFE